VFKGPTSSKFPIPTPEAPCSMFENLKSWVTHVFAHITQPNSVTLTGPPCNQRIIGHGLEGFSTL